MARAFDNNVRYLLENEELRPAQTQKKKSECTPMEWAQKLKYQQQYYTHNVDAFRVYQRRWECKSR